MLEAPPSREDLAVGEQLLSELIFIHLHRNSDKFALLTLMLRKLYALVRTHTGPDLIARSLFSVAHGAARPCLRPRIPPPRRTLSSHTPSALTRTRCAQASGRCQGDNPDSLMHQEVLLPGHLLQQFLKERLQDWQARLKEFLLKEAADKPSINFDDTAVVEKCISKASDYADIGKRMAYLLATGNLVSRSGMGLSQTSGFTIVAEKLNFLRHLSHFRSVHRGAYFQELRTTTVR